MRKGMMFTLLLGFMLGSLVRAVEAPAQIPALNWEPRSDWVSVKGPGGAVGDGVADDTAAIQQVLSAAKSGTTIYFPPGAYRVTRTLELRGAPGSGGRLMGVQVIGHGRDTQLVWDGNAGEKLWIDDGVVHCRYMGLLFDGRNTAAVGFYHENIGYHFETNLRNQYLAFRNFTQAGVLTGLEPPATAEITFEHCLFEHCGTGLTISKSNDYDYTIEGCEFRRCGTGVRCTFGNFYLRDSRFEASREADIDARPLHGCSIRRCVSVGSFTFLKYVTQPIAPLTVQDCQVSGWRNPEGAIIYSGAPLLMFDCVFRKPPGKNPPVTLKRADQVAIVSGNRAVGVKQVLRADSTAPVYVIPAGKRQGALRSTSMRFLKSEACLPGKVFDAKRDFGAIGNARTDDTAAIQQCIDAARAHGRGAIAYLPTGVYIISRTLTITGKDYTVGGAGFSSMLYWRGADGGVMVAVHDPQNVTLENLNVGNHDIFPLISGIPMKNGIDILQTGSGQPSSMTYDGVWVFGKYQRQPDRKGLVCRNLGANAMVRLNCVEGNLRFTDCAAATILANTTYEGSVTVDGKDPRRTGLLGFMTRLGTVVSHGLYLRDNQNIVMSDFYIEQADGGCVFEGGPGLPAGRATIGNHKFHFGADGNPEWIPGDPLTIHNYAGEIFWGPSKPREGRAKTWRIVHTGDQPVTLWIYAGCFYTRLTPTPELQPSAKLYLLGVERVQPDDVAVFQPPVTMKPHPLEMAASYAPPPKKLRELSSALDDFRRLGEMDIKLNYATSSTSR